VDDERVWQVPEDERELALLEKSAEGRNVLAFGLPPELLPALARRSRALLATPLSEVVLGLPRRGFSLVIVGELHEVPLHLRPSHLLDLCSPAALVATYGDVLPGLLDPLAQVKRVGELRLGRPVGVNVPL
jgi:hypothetical protein